MDAPDASVTAKSLTLISQSDDDLSLGLAAAAGNLHRLLIRQRVAGHLMASSPDLGEEVLVAVPVERSLPGRGHKDFMANSAWPTALSESVFRLLCGNHAKRQIKTTKTGFSARGFSRASVVRRRRTDR